MTTSSTKRSQKGLLTLLALACASSLMPVAAQAQSPSPITTVFYILLENRCFTSGTDKSQSNILYNNINGGSPFITAMCTPGNTAYMVNYQGSPISITSQCSFCSCYHNDFGTASGNDVSPNLIGTEAANQPNGTSIHPSEPQYVFMEAGSNLSKLDDNDPYGSTLSVEQINTFLTNNPSFSGKTSAGCCKMPASPGPPTQKVPAS